MDVQKLKTPQGPPFTFFGTMRLTGDQKKLLLFLNLRYGADLGRSRLVFFQVTLKGTLFSVCLCRPFVS